eukprot:c22018_g1_i1 orf=169-1056(+)
MKRAGEALGTMFRQAFMTREEYREVREDERAWRQLQRPLSLVAAAALLVLVSVGALLALCIIFPSGGTSPFCSKHPIPPSGITDDSMHSYYFTEYEATQYFWFVVFIPTFLVFFVSAIYLIAGMAVAYSAPERHGCVKVVENNCCASKKGGVRCLATLNVSFAIVFGLMALFLGSTILTLETDCSVTLFWCYEMICWGLVFLYGGTFFFLRRKAAVIMDEGEFYGSRTIGMELLEASPDPSSPEMERRLNAGFRSWMGSSILSSDDEEEGPATGGLDDVWDRDLYENSEIGRRAR